MNPGQPFLPGLPSPTRLSECVSGKLYHLQTKQGTVFFITETPAKTKWKYYQGDCVEEGSTNDLKAFLRGRRGGPSATETR